jgi:hypothetical protein
MKALMSNGIDENKRIIGTEAPHPFLYNIPIEFVERFRKQISLIDLQFHGDPKIIKEAVWSCYQEEMVEFHGYNLYDVGAYPEPALSGRITFRVTQPWSEPADNKEREARERAKEMIESLRTKIKNEKVKGD